MLPNGERNLIWKGIPLLANGESNLIRKPPHFILQWRAIVRISGLVCISLITTHEVKTSKKRDSTTYRLTKLQRWDWKPLQLFNLASNCYFHIPLETLPNRCTLIAKIFLFHILSLVLLRFTRIFIVLVKLVPGRRVCMEFRVPRGKQRMNLCNGCEPCRPAVCLEDDMATLCGEG